MRRNNGAGSGESVALLKKLVKIPSVNPSEGGSGEAEIAEFVRGELESYGLHSSLQTAREGRVNVIGRLKGTGNGPTLMLNGHLDTVGVSGMTVDPFGAHTDGRGRLHGRGACDTKGSIASMMSAIKAVADSSIRLKGDVIFTGVVDEEYLSIGTESIIKEYRSDAAIVGEPTNLDVAIAHRGYAWVEVEVMGRASHGSMPEKGVDAIAEMAKFVSMLSALQERYRGSKKKHPLLGNPTIHTSMVEGGSAWSIVPESCTLKLERRTLPGEASNISVTEARELVEELSADDPDFHATVSGFFERPAMEVPRTERVVRAVSSAHQSATKRRARLVGLPYWTDAALLVREAGIPTCVFGPGEIALAHSADEYVPVAGVVTGAEVFAGAIRMFCGSRSS